MAVGSIAYELHQDDLPQGVSLGNAVAVDTETMGLAPHRDRLCLVQLYGGVGPCHLVQFRHSRFVESEVPAGPSRRAPNLSAILQDESVTKIFHFARFDVAMLMRYLGVTCSPIYCTKIASKLARTYTDRHGLKDLCRELLSHELSKEQQSSDWGTENLSDEQIHYAAQDVLYLHRLRDRLDSILSREGRTKLAASCFSFVPCRARLDLEGWDTVDVFAH